MKKKEETRKEEIHPLELIKPRSLKFLSHKLINLVESRLWLKVIVGMFLGIILGLILGPTIGIIDPQVSAIFVEWLALPGTVFLRIIQMIIIPLIFASVIRGIAANNNIQSLKKIGLVVVVYFIFTTIIAISLGIVLVSVIEPGQYISQETIQSSFESTPAGLGQELETPKLQEVPALLGTILTTNPIGSMLHGEMLQIVILSIIFGIALVNMSPKRSRPIIELMGSLQEVCMTIVKWAMILAPIAVFGLMTKVVSQLGIEALIGTSVYVLTVLLGLLLLLLFYLLIVFFVGGIHPKEFLKSAKDVQLLAFSTSSSAAVMPLSIKTAEEKLRVRPSISQFIIPIGTTINMDGTALYQAIAIVFLAQVFGIDLALTALLLLVVTIVGASIGSPGTPGVGMVILAGTLGTLGIPIAGIALIIGVDRLLDMNRTAINVTGDLTACVVLNKIVKLDKSRREEINEQTRLEIHRTEKGVDVIIHEHTA